jgi:hypothetical protein
MARPTFYDETKKSRTIRISDSAWEGWDNLARELDLSRSEIMERIGRGVTIAENKQTVTTLLSLLVTQVHNRDNEQGRTK